MKYLIALLPLLPMIACADADPPAQDPDPSPGEPEPSPQPEPEPSPEPDEPELEPDEPEPYAVERTLPDTALLGAPRGMTQARSLIHMHTIHSHDACDGQPRLEDGLPNALCDADWREGVCATRQDIVFTTDHEELAAFEDFETLLLVGQGDQIIEEDGEPVASLLRCPDGHQVMLMPGGEFGVMPVGMRRHLPGDAQERDRLYAEVTPERVASFKELDAVVLQAHTESRGVDELRRLGLDGFEIYNLHANIDPDIREEFLGLEAFGFTEALAPFLVRGGPTSDLVILGFLSESGPALRAFDTLLAEGQHLVGTGGTDAHRNALPFKLPDGERADSFRRMARFFSNHLMLRGDRAPATARTALREGRSFVVFEVLGSPVGMDFRAEAAGDITEMGDRVSLAASPTLILARPGVFGLDVAPPMSLRILRATADGAVEVAAGDDELSFTPTVPGAYRAEIRMRPEHLRAALGDLADALIKDTIWIYANPIYVD